MILLEPVITEKAIKRIESENKLTFVVVLNATKKQIKEEIEKIFNVKVEKVNTQISKNKKIAFIKLKKETPAIDIATKLGII
ncbi:MAG: 50S ribosomal protein L23 [Candidatus Pacearchaeota archaeon]|nr:50S ribosomal protein L23 [Candidatus Pacearchaeota archaeon]